MNLKKYIKITHKVVMFDQYQWIKSDIVFNREIKEKTLTNSFEKDFLKLMSSSVKFEEKEKV